MNSSECLRSLEALMNEFFHDSTSNDRKRQIEVILNQFAKQDNCWDQCLQYLTQTDNEFTRMYCLSVLENHIVLKWHSLGSDRRDKRLSVWNYLLTCHQSMAPFVRNKTAKLLVIMARIDWPNSYPDFMQNILDLFQANSTICLALVLLKTAIEELSQPRDDICAQRRAELNKLLVSEMPNILSSLTNLMELILDKHCNFLTATPPPSPSQSPNPESNHSSFNKDVLCSAFESSLRRGLLQTVPDMDSESLEISSQVLLCLSQVFAFMPLNCYHQINNSTLAALFVFATFGSNNKNVIGGHNLSSNRLGVLAMNCVNELMAKCSTTSETNEFIFNIFQNTFHLLRKLTKNSELNNEPNCASLENLDEEYISKFTEFLRYFIGGHLPRFEKMPTFPTMEFLGLVFEYTFKQTNCEPFLAALELWNILIDYLTLKIKHDSKQMDQILGLYKEPIVSLLVHLSRKIQFRYNQRWLDQLDNESLDDDSMTEWQHFSHNCIEIIANIADMYPLETYEVVTQLYNENIVSFFGLENCLQFNDNKCIALEVSETDICRLHCTLRDLSTGLRLVGRLSEHITSENFNRWFISTKALIEKQIQALILFNKCQFHKQKLLTNEFIDVCAQLMATMKAYSHWLQLYCADDQTNSAVLISAIVDNCIQFLTCDRNGATGVSHQFYLDNTVHSAVHLFYSVTTYIRPVFLLSVPSVQMLFDRVCSFLRRCDNTTNAFQTIVIPDISPEVERLLCRSFSNMFLLPWFGLVGDNPQNWESRTTYHDILIEAVVAPFKNVFDNPTTSVNGSVGHQSSKELQMHRSLALLTDIVENHKESPTRTKQLLLKSIETSLEAFINLFATYFTNPVIAEDCLQLFNTVFDVLRNQISFEFVEKTIQLMLKLFSNNNSNGMSCETMSTKVIPKFLKMLTFIVQQPGSAFKSLLPGMISFAFDKICPTVVSSDCPQLKSSLYEFLFQLLLNNWKYFYPNNGIVSHLLVSSQHKSEDLQNAEAFVQIMNVFAQSFLQNDISVFKHNLDALEALNTRQRLYQKEIFRQTMAKHFVFLFIQTLLDKSLVVLEDDLRAIVYNMASVDFPTFFNVLIPHFVYNCEGLNDIQRNSLTTKCFDQNERDFPSFVSNLNVFLNDLRYYKSVSFYVQ